MTLFKDVQDLIPLPARSNIYQKSNVKIVEIGSKAVLDKHSSGATWVLRSNLRMVKDTAERIEEEDVKESKDAYPLADYIANFIDVEKVFALMPLGQGPLAAERIEEDTAEIVWFESTENPDARLRHF